MCIRDRNLDTPKAKKTLPKYLSLEQSLELLTKVSGEFPQRDYCMLVLLLNCGLRRAELAGLNLEDIGRDNTPVSYTHLVGGISGVIGGKATHLCSADEKKQVPKPSELLIDIGAASKEEAEALVRPGAVSYTHLDVYKRQEVIRSINPAIA